MQKIYLVRGSQAVLDSDLADYYQTETKVLNQAVRRNLDRFPPDFMFQLTAIEANKLGFMRDPNETAGRGGRRYRPYAFTQEGVAMLSAVLNSERAILATVLIMRAFVQLRQISESHENFAARFDALEAKVADQSQMLTKIYEGVSAYMSRPQLSSPSQTKAPPKLPQISLVASIPEDQQKKANSIIEITARHFKLPESALKSSSRQQPIVLPKQIAIYLTRKHTGLSFAQIGQLLGGKHHTTILHAHTKVLNAVARDPSIALAVATLESSLRS